MIVKDKTNRNILIEGRNKGFGISFAQINTRDDDLQVLIPISACKDFLNDQIYTFHTGITIRQYGLTTINVKNYLNNDYFYMVGKILHHKVKAHGTYSNYDRDLQFSIDNRNALLSFINYFEMELKLDSLTEFLYCENDESLIIFKVPSIWALNTYNISFYTMLARIGLFYKYENIEDYLKNFNFDLSDSFNAHNLIKDFKKMVKLNAFFKKQNFNNFNKNKPIDIHNYGYKQFLYREG